jgi:RNA polymerase sigma-70 factor (ECF subfamily)
MFELVAHSRIYRQSWRVKLKEGESDLGNTDSANSDSALIQRARRGNPNAVGEIYERYQPAVYSYVYYRLGNAAAAEDLTAEVFVRLVTKIRTYEDRGKPILAWLYTIAHNLLANQLRHDDCLEMLPLDETLDTVEDQASDMAGEAHLTQHEIQAAMAQLTEPQRQVVWLKFIEGYSNAEAAAVIDRDENAVKSLQHRALAAMRRAIEMGRTIRLDASSVRKVTAGEERSRGR